MNKLSLAPAAQSVNQSAWEYEQFRFGWDRMTAREPLASCTTSAQTDGYMAALRAASDRDTNIYLQGRK